MRRISTRIVLLVIGGIIFAISDLWADHFSCDGSQSNSWAIDTAQRLEKGNEDIETFLNIAYLGSTFSGEKPVDLLSRAQRRYYSQISTDPPRCLENFNDDIIGIFWDEWKIFESYNDGDLLATENYIEKYEYSWDSAIREFDKLCIKYGWDC